MDLLIEWLIGWLIDCVLDGMIDWLMEEKNVYCKYFVSSSSVSNK